MFQTTNQDWFKMVQRNMDRKPHKIRSKIAATPSEKGIKLPFLHQKKGSPKSSSLISRYEARLHNEFSNQNTVAGSCGYLSSSLDKVPVQTHTLRFCLFFVFLTKFPLLGSTSPATFEIPTIGMHQKNVNL